MSLFARPHYQSDATQFIDSLKSARPELEAQQRQGRALLWEQQVDADWNADADEGRVKQQSYVYQTEATLR
ncbi:MAG: hypothetical protein RLZZ555_2331 [Pseudomonadota bacterium]|jgi:hypothetical protein